MNVSLNWLTDYVDVGGMKAQELADVLTNIGLNVDAIEQTDSDVVLDVEVTSNRGDCLGHLGIARELGAALGLEFRPPAIGEFPTSGDVNQLATVEVLEPQLCPRYTARVIRGLKVGPSPQWLVERLAAVGLRSVNNVVDVTNYVLMEYSQPLHSFDYDKLAGHRIIVRRAKDGEVMTAIDQTQCRLGRDMLVIADADKAVAVAGVMGGLDTEVGPATTSILLESAIFDPQSVRKTSRSLRLMSDSNYRFERGVDPVGVDEASRRACQLILQLAGGQLADGMIDRWAKPWKGGEIILRPSRCDAVLGAATPVERQVEILAALGLNPRLDGEVVGNQAVEIIRCTAPSYRADLTREIDLIEEIARHVGLSVIPLAGRVSHEVVTEALPQKARRRAISVLNACGYDEAMTPAFIDADEANLFDAAAKPLAVREAVRKTNNVLRPTLLASLLRACKTNQNAGNGDVSLFELGSVLQGVEGRDMPSEHVELALVTTDEVRALRGTLETLAADFSPSSRLSVQPGQMDGLADGSAAAVLLDDQPIGRLGLISAAIQDRYGLEKPVAVATINFDAVAPHAGNIRRYEPLPRFPAVTRDLSVIVDEPVQWRQIEQAIDELAQPTREAVDYVTTYRGKPVEAGRKSVTLTLTYRGQEGTLRGEQVDEMVSQVVEALGRKLGAVLRA